MVMIDPIVGFLTRIRSANMVKHETSEVPASEVKHDIVETLKREGLIRDAEYIEGNKQDVVHVLLKYGKNEERVITNLKRIPKPGSRTYIKADEVPKVLNGLGIATIPTSKGVITDKEARAENIGGEVIAYVW